MPSEVVTNLLNHNSDNDSEAVVTQPLKNTVYSDEQRPVKEEQVVAPSIIDHSKSELTGEKILNEEIRDNVNASDFVICCSNILTCFSECWLCIPHLIFCDGACMNECCDCCMGCCECCGDL